MAALRFSTLLLTLLAFPARGERPFLTEEAPTLEPAVVSLDAGFLFRDQPRDFGVAPRDRQWDVGEIRLSFGLGRVAELQVSGSVISAIESPSRSSTNSGDWILGTKVRLAGEKNRRPALTFLYEVKLPNGSDERGGATDETDFFGYLIATRSLGPDTRLHGNLGLGILGNPFDNAAQNDIYILRLAWERRLASALVVGIEGVAEGGPKEGDDPRYLRLAVAKRFRKLTAHGSVGWGFGDDADRLHASLGLRARFELRRPGGLASADHW